MNDTDDEETFEDGLIRELTAERDRWKKHYYDVADAVCAESSSCEDLCRRARETREQRNQLREDKQRLMLDNASWESSYDILKHDSEKAYAERGVLLEAAFREGYGQGYDQGSSDQCSHEWGCGGGSAQSRKAAEDQEWRDSEARKALHPCPKCGSRNVGDHHHNGNALAPECHYWACYDCNHQWDHQ